MNKLNLLISAPRFNEIDAKAELWFTLLICGDSYPIISDLEFQGLITALTSIELDKVMKEINLILTKDPYFYNYILKIVPIQFSCETDLGIIKHIIEKNKSFYIKEHESFRIKLNRRKNKLIGRKELISTVAENIQNPVDLENPDKTIHIELLNKVCGISFLKKGDIIKPKNLYMES